MKLKDYISLSIIMLIIIIFISSCSQQQITLLEPPKSKLATKQPSELMLDISEFIGNYSIRERTPRLKSDLSNDSKNLGWKEGYLVKFSSINEDTFDITFIQQFISVYPIENISKVLDISPESNENEIYDEMPALSIGDKSRAWRITSKDEWGNSERIYEIEFIKMNIYEDFYMSGTATDYEALKILAKKAEEKIN